MQLPVVTNKPIRRHAQYLREGAHSPSTAPFCLSDSLSFCSSCQADDLSYRPSAKDETEKYIDDVVLLRDEDQGAKQKMTKLLFGTDNTHYRNGRPVILIEPQ